ncbi:hypothetical protein [Planctomyces sp. SH-PL14]|uniref:hypothetical protein n=1 Tax=Planctomyces sp. SH-PL14 TaxID=1632864 RepID=UPI0012E72E86|nr:hypothetical protein [Planctomyces sp. SH-PL14]
MKQELLTLGAGAMRLLEEVAGRSATGMPAAGMRGRLSDVAELLGLSFVTFESGTLIVEPRGTRFLKLANRYEDGSASIPHDDLGRDFKPGGKLPRWPKA